MEYSLFLSLFYRNDSEEKYLHLIRYKEENVNASEEEWMGRIKYLSKVIKRSRQETEEKIKK